MGYDIIAFYKECAARAFRGKFWQVEKWTGGLSIALLFVTYAASLNTDIERAIQVEIPLLFFVVSFLGTVFVGFILAPVEMYQEQRAERQSLAEQQIPKLQLMLPGDGVAEVSLAGNTLETWGGNRHTNIRQWSDTAIYLLVTNMGHQEAVRCKARVLWASRETDDETLESSKIIEAIELPWSKTDTKNHLSADIAPQDTCRIWIANVRQQGNLWVYRDIEDLPIHYQRVFGDQGHHKMLIQVDSTNVAPTQILLSIHTEAAVKPEGNGSWTPKATVSILGQGGPILVHPDIPDRIGVVGNSRRS